MLFYLSKICHAYYMSLHYRNPLSLTNLFLLNRTMPWLFIWQLQLNRESMWDSGDKLQRNNERSQFLITGLHEGCLCLSLLLVCFRFHNALIALCFILYEKMFWKTATILGFMHGKCQSIYSLRYIYIGPQNLLCTSALTICHCLFPPWLKALTKHIFHILFCHSTPTLPLHPTWWKGTEKWWPQ
jgi:hypothetical protein